MGRRPAGDNRGAVIGKTVKWLRTANNKSLDEVSGATGLTKGYLPDLENGKVPTPGFFTILSICQYFHVSISWMAGENNPFTCFQASQFFTAFGEKLAPEDWGALWGVAERLTRTAGTVAEREQADGKEADCG